MSNSKEVSPIKIRGNITAKSTISGSISHLNKEEPVPKYEGNYTVLPLAFQDTVLLTKDKKMTDNVIIKEIPYYETSNSSGGSTVYIAGQIEFG